MKQKLIISFAFLLVVAILVVLNVASYTQKQKDPESEMFPNRSSFNPGPTGTQALYSLLSETGRKVVRWQETADGLEKYGERTPVTFVVIGPYRRNFTDPEYAALFRWVASGGQLVMIDREPPEELLKTTANWSLVAKPQDEANLFNVDPSDPQQMIADTPAVRPGQPSLFNFGVNAVQPSRFASEIVFERYADQKTPTPKTSAMPPPRQIRTESTPSGIDEFQGSDEEDDEVLTSSLFAPLSHLASKGRNILVDAPFGSGRVVILSDPYIVSNSGIPLADNAQLAVNIVSSRSGLIAIDEYHHGFGGNNNRLLEFFAGTPVIAIFLQAFLFIGLVFFSRSRRFGRPIPIRESDRLSKLEYIGAIADLQQRTKTFDLAIENIYGEFRRRAARVTGLDYNGVSRSVFAARVAQLTKSDPKIVEDLMFKCEDIIAGEPTNKNEVLNIVAQIRRLENLLGSRSRGAV